MGGEIEALVCAKRYNIKDSELDALVLQLGMDYSSKDTVELENESQEYWETIKPRSFFESLLDIWIIRVFADNFIAFMGGFALTMTVGMNGAPLIGMLIVGSALSNLALIAIGVGLLNVGVKFLIGRSQNNRIAQQTVKHDTLVTDLRIITALTRRVDTDKHFIERRKMLVDNMPPAAPTRTKGAGRELERAQTQYSSATMPRGGMSPVSDGKGTGLPGKSL